MRSLHPLPKFSDRWSHIFLEHGQLDVHASGVRFVKGSEEIPLPIDQLNLILLGPGTSITHEAVKVLSNNSCLLAWVGEEGVRMYAHSTGSTFSSRRLLLQAKLASDDNERLAVAKRMYLKRFDDDLTGMSIEQLRGMEGQRVRICYQKYATFFNINWERRDYDQGSWFAADLPNRALSAANACLYGIVHAGIVAAGYFAGIGFIHTGKMLSFVYDVADFYKTEISIPIAFKEVLEGEIQLERRVRLACRDAFHKYKLMDKILPDIAEVLGASNDNRESPNEFEGKAITLDGGTSSGGFPREPDKKG